jgi:hypothetical protein
MACPIFYLEQQDAHSHSISRSGGNRLDERD